MKDEKDGDLEIIEPDEKPVLTYDSPRYWSDWFKVFQIKNVCHDEVNEPIDDCGF